MRISLRLFVSSSLRLFCDFCRFLAALMEPKSRIAAPWSDVSWRRMEAREIAPLFLKMRLKAAITSVLDQRRRWRWSRGFNRAATEGGVVAFEISDGGGVEAGVFLL